MKTWEYAITVALGLVNLVVAILVVTSAQDSRQLQEELVVQQQKIQQAATVQQSVQPVLVDMARVAVENPSMRELLAGHGFRVNVEPPGSTPAQP